MITIGGYRGKQDITEDVSELREQGLAGMKFKVDVTTAREPDPRVAHEEVLQQFPSLQPDAVQPGATKEHRRVVHEERDVRRLVFLQLVLDPRDLVTLDVPRNAPRHLRIQPEAQPRACPETEVDAVGGISAAAVAEYRAHHGSIVVVARDLPEAVTPWLEDGLNGAIGLGELIVGVIARDDDVIQMLP